MISLCLLFQTAALTDKSDNPGNPSSLVAHESYLEELSGVQTKLKLIPSFVRYHMPPEIAVSFQADNRNRLVSAPGPFY